MVEGTTRLARESERMLRASKAKITRKAVEQRRCSCFQPSALGLLLLLVFCLLPSSATGQEIVDKTVATVNGGVQIDLITYSDLLWQLALQPGTPVVNPNSEALNSALRLVEDQRLILQEAQKLPTLSPTDQEITAARDALVKAFSSQAELQERMKRVGLTSDKFNEIIEQRVRIEKYLDFRFRSFIVITQKDISDYYNDVFVARFKRRYPGRVVTYAGRVPGRNRKEPDRN